MLIIDAHSHLWWEQDTVVDGCHIHPLEGNRSRSTFFDGERQMLPPFMIDGHNTAEVFLSNMDYAQVNAAVVVQEFIDGNQNRYLHEVEQRYGNSGRFLLMGMALTLDEARAVHDMGLRGIALPGHRLHTPLPDMMPMFRFMEQKGMILSLCLHEDNHQLPEVEEIIAQCPELKIAIGHFGMVTSEGWMEQIRLAHHRNVMVESGGITWLFNAEFYPFDGAMRAIRQAADEVGIEKLMWGSDYPRTITAITYRMSYDFVLRSPLLNDREKALFLGENARRFYGFGSLAELPYVKNMSE
ncbi:MAG: amidohydrolase [Bacteroidales bacterium]|nr:amidohydrolase [Candidatus Liminaster caballi]